MSREKVLELVDSGVLTPYQVMLSCLNYMSQADVVDMAECEGFIMAECEGFIEDDEDCDFDGDEDDEIADDENYPDPHEHGEYPELD